MKFSISLGGDDPGEPFRTPFTVLASVVSYQVRRQQMDAVRSSFEERRRQADAQKTAVLGTAEKRQTLNDHDLDLDLHAFRVDVPSSWSFNERSNTWVI